MGTYEHVFRASTGDPESFWLKAAEAIDWDVTP
jgi:propionyl-CoA synthetase